MVFSRSKSDNLPPPERRRGSTNKPQTAELPRLRTAPDLLRPQPYRGPLKKPLPLAVEPRNIVILGGSFAGLSCAHYFLDHVLPKLQLADRNQPYRLIIISPSTHIYWNIGAPRALVVPDSQSGRFFLPIKAGFDRHAGKLVAILQGRAIAWNVDQRTIAVEMLDPEVTSPFVAEHISSQAPWTQNRPSTTPQKPSNNVQSVKYHALMICTGSSTHSDLLGLHGPHNETLSALRSFHNDAKDASRIVVGGGGASGVEVAGQLATYLNFKGPWPMRRRVKNPKEIILITGSDRCLPGHRNEKISAKAELMLRDLGVRIIHRVRVLGATTDRVSPVASSSSSPPPPPQTLRTKIALNNGTNIRTDLYIPCTGLAPNSEFVPDNLKDKEGYILTDSKTMRIIPAGGERVYCIGDVASYSMNYVFDIYAAVPTMMQNLLNDLLRHTSSSSKAEGEPKMEVKDAEYQQRVLDCQLCPISRFGGVGILLGFRVPSLGVHLLKGHDYRLGKAKKVVAFGWNPYGPKKTQLCEVLDGALREEIRP